MKKKRARIDKNFRLFVVTQALSSNAELLEFSGQQIEKRFSFSPVAYFAELK